jgi:hypothetical protein
VLWSRFSLYARAGISTKALVTRRCNFKTQVCYSEGEFKPIFRFNCDRECEAMADKHGSIIFLGKWYKLSLCSSKI